MRVEISGDIVEYFRYNFIFHFWDDAIFFGFKKLSSSAKYKFTVFLFKCRIKQSDKDDEEEDDEEEDDLDLVDQEKDQPSNDDDDDEEDQSMWFSKPNVSSGTTSQEVVKAGVRGHNTMPQGNHGPALSGFVRSKLGAARETRPSGVWFLAETPKKATTQ
ncbi:hypothetical protein L6452_02362 [Arctium lappa]|uniref:Uncharacterized protein n=1 Tax=Arctium lappa TaxID=4217 RepID=A0ACB9FIN2_ARCLA|nr:hypothetical protein L6452_02362 [Arctium lappa]